MLKRRTLKLIHLVGTVWFVLSLGYVCLSSLQRAGFNWWVIFSVSGHTALLIFLLVSLYLFAVFRGFVRSQKIEIEHPLTGTNYYMALYLSAPFLGGVAGCIGMVGVNTVGRFTLGVALGTLALTFLFWVILDPLTGLIEMLLPSSREHRAERLARLRALRHKRQEEKKRLLADLLAMEQQERSRWQQVLQPYAERLAGLLAGCRQDDFYRAEHEAVDIGLNAWQMGGLTCMRQLRDMTISICRKNYQDSAVVDYVSSWWDGIGTWRKPSLQEMMNL